MTFSAVIGYYAFAASYDGDAPVITSVVPLSSSELLVRWSYTPVWLPDQPIECYRVWYATVREGVGPDAPTLDRYSAARNKM